MKKIVIYYNFILISILTIIGFLQAQSFAQTASAILFFPLAVYFGKLVLPKKQKAINIIPVSVNEEIIERKTRLHHKKEHADSLATQQQKDVDILEELSNTEEGALVDEKEGLDIDRRMFLKLIGSAGLTVFFFSIFTKKAHGAFFGSVPGPGTVALKDISGNRIDPAVKQPTDGYKIAKIDDSGAIAYYGFLDKDGKWFIQKEDSGDYTYATGDSGFSTAWTNRADTGLVTYNTFDNAF